MYAITAAAICSFIGVTIELVLCVHVCIFVVMIKKAKWLIVNVQMVDFYLLVCDFNIVKKIVISLSDVFENDCQTPVIIYFH